MINFLKTTVGALALIAATGAVASPISTWVDTVSKRISALTDVVDFAAPSDGQIVVRFNRGADGRATNVQFERGLRSLTPTAERALSRLGALPPLPVGYDSKMPIAMNLIIGSPASLDGNEGRRFRRAYAAAVANAAKTNALIEQAHDSQLAMTDTPR